MVVKSDNPLVEIVHERSIERPDSLFRFHGARRNKPPSHYKADQNLVAQAVSMLGSLLSQKGHTWSKGQKKLYKRAIKATRHPCCPTCGKPMNESAVTHEGKIYKSWFCLVDQNL